VMMRTRTIAALLAVMAMVVTPARGEPGARAPDLAAGSFVADEVLVKIRPDARAGDVLATVGGRVIARMDAIGWLGVQVPRALGALDAVQRLRAHPGVLAADVNHTGRIALTPDDRCFLGCVNGARQWNLAAVNALAGWDVLPSSFYTASEKQALPMVKVAVLDTKIDTGLIDWVNVAPPTPTHQYDAANGGQLAMSDAKDFVPSGSQQGSAAYHGSFVAGILGAAANNNSDIAGVGYRASVMPVTVVDGNGATTALWLTQGIEWAVVRGAKVINMSLGVGGFNQAVQDAINYALDEGVLPVAAAGNNANDQPFYPAWHLGVMSVTAVDVADRHGSCSNYGGVTSVAAPGVGILSLDPSRPEGLWVAPCGTSTAAPHVSALAALLFAQDLDRSPGEVRSIIERNADDDRFRPGPDEWFGHGRINIERALRDGDEPDVLGVVATFPRNTGGTSTVTASATATSPTAIMGAEWFLDELGAPDTRGTPLAPADGSWGGDRETLTASIPVPITVPTGVHRLFVRATDGTTWGPASVGVLIVDRTPPVISDFSVTPTAVTVSGQGVRIAFRATDDHATAATFSYTVSRTVLGVKEVVFESTPMTMTLPGMASATWMPQLTDAGQYEIKLTVRDEAQNPAFRTASTLVL